MAEIGTGVVMSVNLAVLFAAQTTSSPTFV